MGEWTIDLYGCVLSTPIELYRLIGLLYALTHTMFKSITGESLRFTIVWTFNFNMTLGETFTFCVLQFVSTISTFLKVRLRD